jgi:hypothetical protein
VAARPLVRPRQPSGQNDVAAARALHDHLYADGERNTVDDGIDTGGRNSVGDPALGNLT